MKKALGVLTAALLAAVTLTATPAQADVSIGAVSLSTSSVILNGDSGCADRIQATVTVNDPTTDADEVWDVSGDVYDPVGDLNDLIIPTYTGRSGDSVTYADWIFLCGFDLPGKYRLHVEVTWWDAELSTTRVESHDVNFYVKRPTSLTYNASPEPAAAGSYLTHSGRLMFDPFDAGAMYGPSGASLSLYFKPAGSTTWQYKTSIVTGAGGYYSRKVQATSDGTWRVTYPENSYRQGQVKYDYVDTFTSSPVIRLTKIQYDSPGTDSGSNDSLNAEWVRLTNKGSYPANLKNWTVRDKSGYIYTFASDLWVPSGYNVYIHTGQGTSGSTHRYWGRSWYVWNNGGDTAYLRSPAGTLIDTCAWSSTGSGYTYC